MKYMIGTDTSIFILKHKPDYLKKKLIRIKSENLLISNVSVGELFYGMFKAKDNKKNFTILLKYLFGLNPVDYGFDAAVEYAKIKDNLGKNKALFSENELQIAGHSKSLNAVLVTNNFEKLKNIKGLKTISWIK